MRRLDPIQIEPDRWCLWCGESLPEPAERDHRQRYCCPECRTAAKLDRRNEARRAARVREPRTCRQCGATFIPKRRDALVCSLGCNWAWQNARQAERRKMGRAAPGASCAPTAPARRRVR